MSIPFHSVINKYTGKFVYGHCSVNKCYDFLRNRADKDNYIVVRKMLTK